MKHFRASFYRLRDILLFVFLENLGQGHVVGKRVLSHLIANINLHKSHTEHIALVLTI